MFDLHLDGDTVGSGFRYELKLKTPLDYELFLSLMLESQNAVEVYLIKTEDYFIVFYGSDLFIKTIFAHKFCIIFQTQKCPDFFAWTN